jgi:hypothetical protein
MHAQPQQDQEHEQPLQWTENTLQNCLSVASTSTPGSRCAGARSYPPNRTSPDSTPHKSLVLALTSLSLSCSFSSSRSLACRPGGRPRPSPQALIVARAARARSRHIIHSLASSHAQRRAVEGTRPGTEVMVGGCGHAPALPVPSTSTLTAPSAGGGPTTRTPERLRCQGASPTACPFARRRRARSPRPGRP